MYVNFQQLYELEFIVFELGKTIVIGNTLVNKDNFKEFASSFFDA